METYALVPDIHRDFAIYNALDRALGDRKASKVFLLGDLEDSVDFPYVINKALQSDKVSDRTKMGFQQFDQGTQQLQQFIHQNFGGIRNFMDAAQRRQVHPSVMQELERHNQLFQTLLKDIPNEFFEEDIKLRHADHKARIDDLIKKHDVTFHGVEGNHDDNLIHRNLSNVDWLCHSDSLRKNGIIGHNSSSMTSMFDQHFLVNYYWAGKQEFVVPQSDPMFFPGKQQPKESAWLEKYSDDHPSIIVTHQEPLTQFSPKYESPFGLTAFTQQNKYTTIFAGHRHPGSVYRDQMTGTLVIRPGINHVALVDFEDDEPWCIRLYKKDDVKALGEYESVKEQYMNEMRQSTQSTSQDSQDPRARAA